MKLISIEREISCAHQLPYDISRECSNLHGHNYKIIYTFRYLRKNVFIDMKELDKLIKSEIDAIIDHSNLNNTIPIPTVEAISEWIFNRISKAIDTNYKGKLDLYSIQVYETNRYSVIYKIND